MALAYRMSTEADETALIRFWSEQSGWDQLTKEQWEYRFVKTPMGPAAFSLAIEEETGKIIGQSAFIPTIVCVEGEEHNAYRPFGAIIDEKYRSKGLLNLQKLIAKMYLLATSVFADGNVSLLHMLPDPRWSRILRLLPAFQTASFPLWCKALPAILEEDKSYTTRMIDANDKSIDDLWLKAIKCHRCMVVRDTRMLGWKISHASYNLIGVYKNEELSGLFACTKKLKDKQWLLSDILYSDADVGFYTVLKAACYWINQQTHKLGDEERAAIQKIGILGTETMEPALKKLGFYEENYQFTFVIHILNKNLSKKELTPKHWYVSAND